jgi:hypothetical protein
MTPLMRFFTLVGIALAAASMQMKSRAEMLPGAEVQQVRTAMPAELALCEND